MIRILLLVAHIIALVPCSGALKRDDAYLRSVLSASSATTCTSPISTSGLCYSAETGVQAAINAGLGSQSSTGNAAVSDVMIPLVRFLLTKLGSNGPGFLNINDLNLCFGTFSPSELSSEDTLKADTCNTIPFSSSDDVFVVSLGIPPCSTQSAFAPQ